MNFTKILVTLVIAFLSITSVKAQNSYTTPDGSVLYNKGFSFTSQNGRFTLRFQNDGNLVLYKDGNNPIWATNTNGRNADRLLLQKDGNLVIYDTNNAPVWASNSQNKGGQSLHLQDDGNLVIYNARNQAIWASNTADRSISSGGNWQNNAQQQGHNNRNNRRQNNNYSYKTPDGSVLYNKGFSFTSQNGRFTLRFQDDGNLVLYKDGNNPIWASNTNGRNVDRMLLQTDGNLVIYDTNNAPVWASNSQNKGGQSLHLQDDGNLVIYNVNNQPIWASNTAGR